MPPANAESLASPLTALVVDAGLRRRPGEAARRRAIDYFAADRMINEVRHIYATTSAR